MTNDKGIVTRMKCNIVDPKAVNCDFLDSFADRTVFQTREWLTFVAETQGATALVAELQQDGKIVGFFSGLTVTRMGVKILGSSFQERNQSRDFPTPNCNLLI